MNVQKVKSFLSREKESEKWYAVTRWNIEDVIAAAEQQGVTLTEEQAAKWWQEHEEDFAERLTQEGNEMLTSEDFEEVASNG